MSSRLWFCWFKKVNWLFLDETDFQPTNMVKVFENPEKYLQGPLADHYGKQEHWVVVGAGMAGLMSASMLLRIGHNVYK